MIKGDGYVWCDQPGCEARYWGARGPAVRAQRQGWFMPREGGAWCPAHLPGWVGPWRARQVAAKAAAEGNCDSE